jgi:AbrB family looped-hinge helix DNA binding protein
VRISETGRITIPKALRERFGLHHGAQVEFIATDQGILIRRKAGPLHPVDRAAGTLDGTGFDVDEYVEAIRGE